MTDTEPEKYENNLLRLFFIPQKMLLSIPTFSILKGGNAVAMHPYHPPTVLASLMGTSSCHGYATSNPALRPWPAKTAKDIISPWIPALKWET